MRRAWFLIRGFLGHLKVPDVCNYSKEFHDIHDFYTSKGGDGTPAHFYKYTCWNCGVEFEI